MVTEGKDCLAARPATTGERRIAAGEHGVLKCIDVPALAKLQLTEAQRCTRVAFSMGQEFR